MAASKPNVGVKTSGSNPSVASNTLSYLEVNSIVDSVTQHSSEIDKKVNTSDLTSAVNNIIDSVEFDDSASGFFVVTVENGIKKISLDIDKLKTALGTTGGTGGTGGTGTPTPGTGSNLLNTDLTSSDWISGDLVQPIKNGQMDLRGNPYAYLLQPNTQDTDGHLFRNPVSNLTNDSLYVFSLEVKIYSGYDKNLTVSFLNKDFNPNSVAFFDLTAVTVENINGSGATIESEGSGWYLVKVPFKAQAVTNHLFITLGSNSTPYAGNGTAGLLISNVMILPA